VQNNLIPIAVVRQ